MRLLEPFGTENTEHYGATVSGFLCGLCEFLCALRVKFFFLP
jgi:hypothetical protein